MLSVCRSICVRCCKSVRLVQTALACVCMCLCCCLYHWLLLLLLLLVVDSTGDKYLKSSLHHPLRQKMNDIFFAAKSCVSRKAFSRRVCKNTAAVAVVVLVYTTVVLESTTL